MNSIEAMKREILRLAKTGNKCIRPQQLSNLFNVPDRIIRQELVKLAEQHLIHLSCWDGGRLRPYNTWASSEEFINSGSCCAYLRVELVTAEGTSEYNEHTKAMVAGRG